MRWLFLEDEDDRRDVEAHIRERLPRTRPLDALAALDLVLADAAIEIEHAPQLAADKTRRRKHSARLAKEAAALRATLAEGRPLWGTAGVDWSMLDAALATVERSAEAEGEALAPPVPGRPPLEWRDRLIAVVVGLYPAGASDADVAPTVRFLLDEFLDGVVDDRDLVDLIRSARRRRPYPPFTVTPTE